MGNIQVLSFEVANLIAAGEVVDRPASAIKEMMENSIDAGARHVTVEIQNGGISLMRVTDDGCGMSAEDLPMAIRRHATSKIHSAADLDGIVTLGFRGEALAAISSVSDMRIMSKRQEDKVGSMLEVRGGTLLGVSEFGCGDGTTVIVEHLFANVPARRKFLKRDVTEAMAVSANVERVALSHPEIAVRFISDGVLKLDTAGDGQLRSAVYAVYGRSFEAGLIPLEGEFDGVEITGFVGRSDTVRANRNGQNFFINHRYIKSRTAQAALEQAFVSYLPAEKFPVCVMNIGLNPARVDVNVHPAKLEVKFSNEKPVFEAIYYTVRQALEQDTGRPALKAETLKPTFANPGVRLSDTPVPVETGHRETIRERQMAIEPASGISMSERPTVGLSRGSKPPQERITAEEYIRRYVSGSSTAAVDSATGGGKQANPAAASRQTTPAAKEDMPEPIGCTPPMQNDMSNGRSNDMTDQGMQIPSQTVLPDDSFEQTASPEEQREINSLQQDSDSESSFDDRRDGPADAAPYEEAAVSQPAEMAEEAAPYRIVGEVFLSYVIVEQGDRMLLIDKHAAHERIIFERLRANMRRHGCDTDSQLLLLPVDVMLMTGEVGIIESFRKELEDLGFSFTCMKNTVRVSALPTGIETSAVADMFAVFAAQLTEGTGNPKLTRDTAFEKALFQASCKAAIKAGRSYSPEQTAQIVDQLMRLPDITFCPHGRPVAMEIKKRALDYRFERC